MKDQLVCQEVRLISQKAVLAHHILMIMDGNRHQRDRHKDIIETYLYSMIFFYETKGIVILIFFLEINCLILNHFESICGEYNATTYYVNNFPYCLAYFILDQ